MPACRWCRRGLIVTAGSHTYCEHCDRVSTHVLSVSCRHCGTELHRLNRPDTIWVDRHGFCNCRKHQQHEPSETV